MIIYDTRRTAIFYMYLASEMPSQYTWERSNFVSKIMKALLINNSNGRSGVIKILNDCANGRLDMKLASEIVGEW